MKKSLSSILLLIAIIMAGCTTEKIGMNPTADGREMMYECLSYLKEGDAEKANAVIADRCPKDLPSARRVRKAIGMK